jgi:sec-independent protein translocase protein TatC
MALVPFRNPSSPQGEDQGQNKPDPEETRSPFGDESDPLDGRMTFLEHLDELRRRITHAVVALLGGFLIAFAFIYDIFEFVYQRLVADVPGGKLIYTEPGEAFFLYIKIAAVCGLLISSPYVMWQVWLFIAPGLYAREKKLAVPFVISSSALFIGGAAFSHYILFPAAWKFFASFSSEFLDFMPRIEPVWGLYVKLLLAMGLVFQMPVIMFVLARLGIVSARFLARNFKYAVLLIFVTAAIITPDGSMVVQTLMAAPMIGLYGIGIVVAWAFGKAEAKDDDDTSP